MTSDNQMPRRVIRRADLSAYTGLKRSVIDDMILRGDFPRGFRVGARAVAFFADDVWQRERATTAAQRTKDNAA